jgi:hypothetical protein
VIETNYYFPGVVGDDVCDDSAVDDDEFGWMVVEVPIV